MAEKRSMGKEFTKGFISENPVLRLVLGTCPTLAVTTSVVNAIGMGIAATIVLIGSNIVISALRKIIPSKVRIPAFVVVIASFVTIVQMLVKAFVPVLDESLGVYLPLIVVNCIILGRAEAFASKNPVLVSAVDGLGMGLGFTTALLCMSSIREIIGAGTFLAGTQSLLALFGENVLGGFDGFTLISGNGALKPMVILILAPGGFFVFGMLMACVNKLAEKKGKPKAELKGCSSCPMAATCSLECKNDIKEGNV
ncbi:MAG: electron transport complex subunit E [Clostridiales bacterium]|nr:electron transport complex subunit E [Clostridiales bacterium]